MNDKKRKSKWQKDINEAIKDYEEKSGVRYDYYGNISRRQSMKSPKVKLVFNYSNIIRLILFIIYLTYQLKSCSII